MKFTKDREEIKAREEELIELKRTIELEKGDTLALIIAGFTTLFPMLLAVLAVFVGIVWLLFLR